MDIIFARYLPLWLLAAAAIVITRQPILHRGVHLIPVLAPGCYAFHKIEIEQMLFVFSVASAVWLSRLF